MPEWSDNCQWMGEEIYAKISIDESERLSIEVTVPGTTRWFDLN
jgi:hypothetical protein